MAATTLAALMALALAGLEDPTQAQARPGPFPQWCPGDFWDSGWGDNWNQISCHADGPGGPQALDPDFPGELQMTVFGLLVCHGEFLPASRKKGQLNLSATGLFVGRS